MAIEVQKDAGAGGALSELDEFSAILKQNFKPRSDVAAREVENAVGTLVREALSDESLIADREDGIRLTTSHETCRNFRPGRVCQRINY